jgi:hypothetical protein
MSFVRRPSRVEVATSMTVAADTARRAWCMDLCIRLTTTLG